MIPIVLPFKSQVLINPLENDEVQGSKGLMIQRPEDSQLSVYMLD